MWEAGGGLLGSGSRPRLQRVRGPLSGFIRVTDVAGVGNLQLVGLLRSDESEGMARNVHIRDFRFDLWHVATHAVVSRRVGFVVGVCLDTRSMGPIGGPGTVTFEAHDGGRF